ncbi:sporadic carbohydrate cluster 2OG-Fe(II) oxygenase [Bacteriovorax sp. Seq25_V]|uniref:sporadic carbohydrate cluster 2OG-Fe(II) oxygenase n=1 Tax=Bacteriovorax sp. Seq25_V TaxID=1201288 RepID=UPI000389E984|nr:sporadic carbohydrate cluster 2OG-Fe(II) oxygenase [Bacteriovorax sp. Seq25_V]EQC46930.1 sporadic carbohydrate cluster 2OG-Fe(II) oxygenase [Bacteriovorax sp. Seq25_V]
MKVVGESEVQHIIQSIRTNGFVVVQLEGQKHERITRAIADSLEKLDIDLSSIERLHEKISLQDLNEIRLKIISSLVKDDFYSNLLLKEFMSLLVQLVGTDLAIQRASGLSIQLPHDESSVLPMHADSLVGNSPYELVIWHPLTRADKSAAMYILPLERSLEVYKSNLLKTKSLAEVFEYVKADMIELSVKPGQIVIFSHNLLHGNKINEEEFTRVSLNTRIKNIFTPYGSKELGSYFRKVQFSVASELGIKFDV